MSLVYYYVWHLIGEKQKAISTFCQKICDVMGQNQSHVAKHKMAEICIFCENVKICPFFVFINNKIFVQVSVI